MEKINIWINGEKATLCINIFKFCVIKIKNWKLCVECEMWTF